VAPPRISHLLFSVDSSSTGRKDHRYCGHFEEAAVFPESPDVGTYWTAGNARDDAIGCATVRAKFGGGKIRVLNLDCKVE